MRIAVIALFLGSLFISSAVTQTLESVSSRATESAEITLARQWELQRDQLGFLRDSAEERVRKVDSWLNSERELIASADAESRQVTTTAQDQLSLTDRLASIQMPGPLRNAMGIDAEVSDAVRSKEVSNLSPEDRIQWVDEFQSANKEVLIERDANLKRATESMTPAESAWNSADVTEINYVLRSIDDLSPPERVSAMDLVRDELNARTLSAQEASASVIPSQDE